MGEQSFLYKNADHVANLNNARLSGKLCDVTIKVNDKEFRAHKIILAANLKYFESMFLNSFQESEQNVVNMQDIKETYLEAMILFAYTGEIVITENNALDLLEVANYLTEDGIKESCIEFLKKHLKKEEAYRAYKFADSIKCCSLKSTAKQTILSNFEECSFTTEFLDFDYESLKDILSNANTDFSQLKQILFEFVMRWIVHDASHRKAYITDLLDFIDITKLDVQQLFEYLCQSIKDQCNIVKVIMSLYHEKRQQLKHETDNLKDKLLIVGVNGLKVNAQYYNFTKKQWSDSREIMNQWSNYIGPGIILNNIFYYTNITNSRAYLHGLDLTTGKNATLISESRLLRLSAVCTCGRYLYFCGGQTVDTSISNQVLRYDPITNSFETLAFLGTKRIGAAAIFYQGYLHVLGGYRSGAYLNSVERYNPISNSWTNFPSTCQSRYLSAVAILDGKLYNCGGTIDKSVEVYDPLKNSWQLVASMNEQRYKFRVVVYEGKLLAIGGNDKKSVEVYDPNKDQWQIDKELSSGFQINHPKDALITSSVESSHFMEPKS